MRGSPRTCLPEFSTLMMTFLKLWAASEAKPASFLAPEWVSPIASDRESVFSL